MKKVDFKFLAIEIAVLYVLCVVLANVFILLAGDTPNLIVSMILAVIYLIPVSIIYFCYGSFVNKKLANKTIQEHASENGFINFNTFQGVGATVLVDEAAGKLAYISNRNPFEFQVVSAREITDVKSTYDKGPFGGTRYVYFQFYYQNVKYKVATFSSRNMASLQSTDVLEAISKGDAFVESINNAKNSAVA